MIFPCVDFREDERRVDTEITGLGGVAAYGKVTASVRVVTSSLSRAREESTVKV